MCDAFGRIQACDAFEDQMCSIHSVGTTSRPPKWLKPQLTRLVDEAPAGGGWLHEIKYDGYRMHACIDGGQVKLTRTGLDWSPIPVHDLTNLVAGEQFRLGVASLKLVERDRQVAHALARRVEHRVGDRRRRAGDADLADAVRAERRLRDRGCRSRSRRSRARRGARARDTPPATGS